MARMKDLSDAVVYNGPWFMSIFHQLEDRLQRGKRTVPAPARRQWNSQPCALQSKEGQSPAKIILATALISCSSFSPPPAALFLSSNSDVKHEIPPPEA